MWAKNRKAKRRAQHKVWEKKALADPRRAPKIIASLRKRQLEDKRRARLRLKVVVIGHYGGRCRCCKETQLLFLTIDHINGGGLAHKRELRNKGMHLYGWLVKNNYPFGFQVLCFNCNCGRSLNGGICPHKGVGHHTS